jgi:hypothetical protein
MKTKSQKSRKTVNVVKQAEKQGKLLTRRERASALKVIKATPVASKVKTFLLNPVYKMKENGKVDTITGTCTEPGCKATRTIHPADSFQVRYCRDHQRAAANRRNQERAKARREAAAAKAAAKQGKATQVTATKEAKLVRSMASPKFVKQLEQLILP